MKRRHQEEKVPGILCFISIKTGQLLVTNVIKITIDRSIQILVSCTSCSPHVREPRTGLDFGFCAVDSTFQSYSVVLGVRILIISGIPDSLSCVPDSKALDSKFNKNKFPRFRIPQATLESRFPYMGGANL